MCVRIDHTWRARINPTMRGRIEYTERSIKSTQFQRIEYTSIKPRRCTRYKSPSVDGARLPSESRNRHPTLGVNERCQVASLNKVRQAVFFPPFQNLSKFPHVIDRRMVVIGRLHLRNTPLLLQTVHMPRTI